MPGKIQQANKLMQQYGLPWLLGRAAYALRMRSGFMTWQMPAYPWEDRPLDMWLKRGIPTAPDTYFAWRQQNAPRFLFDQLPDAKSLPDDQTPIDEANAALQGHWRYFSHETHQVGFPPDWHRSALDGDQWPHNIHWSLIPDFGGSDIKYVWEPSRFAIIFTLVRAYARTQNDLYAEAFWKLIEDWIEKNPPQLGPNWKCGQETSLRLMAWCFGLYGFWLSSTTTPMRLAKFTQAVAAQAERVSQNVGYARSTRSNHGISEAVGLWTVGVLFPELEKASHYRDLGRRELLYEASYQFLADGSYSMHSLNYHRMALHTILWALRLGEQNDDPLPQSLYDTASRSTKFIYQLTDLASGQPPNHGSSDGSLILPLSSSDYNDYRPLLQLGYRLTHQQRILPAGPWDETLTWFGYDASQSRVTEQSQVTFAFRQGGYYTLRDDDSMAFIHAPTYTERPQHSDPLHVDLWWRGQPIAIDAGTYRYNAPDPWNNALALTGVHNTVVVDNREAMTRVSRFTWVDWLETKHTAFEHGNATDRSQTWVSWHGAHNGYEQLADPVQHRRSLIRLDDGQWVVIDHLTATETHHYRLHWLLNDFDHQQHANGLTLATPKGDYAVKTGLQQGTGALSIVRADDSSTRGWQSRYYGHKFPAISLAYACDATQATFWTVFAPAETHIDQQDNLLTLTSSGTTTQIDLTQGKPITPTEA